MLLVVVLMVRKSPMTVKLQVVMVPVETMSPATRNFSVLCTGAPIPSVVAIVPPSLGKNVLLAYTPILLAKTAALDENVTDGFVRMLLLNVTTWLLAKRERGYTSLEVLTERFEPKTAALEEKVTAVVLPSALLKAVTMLLAVTARLDPNSVLG